MSKSFLKLFLLKAINKIMKPILNYDTEDKKWKLKTPIILNDLQLSKLTTYCMAQYKSRLNGEIGNRKREMIEAMKTLRPSNIHQYLINDGSDKILYENFK